ncbi:MAG: hypothetical protein ACRD3M_11595, partial [Thermoanaerobaculia bacterium]
MKGKRRSRALLSAALATLLSCASASEASKNRELARTKGKFQVRLTEDSESVMGRCKFVRMLSPNMDPVAPPTDSQLPDWLRA